MHLCTKDKDCNVAYNFDWSNNERRSAARISTRADASTNQVPLLRRAKPGLREVFASVSSPQPHQSSPKSRRRQFTNGDVVTQSHLNCLSEFLPNS